MESASGEEHLDLESDEVNDASLSLLPADAAAREESSDAFTNLCMGLESNDAATVQQALANGADANCIVHHANFPASAGGLAPLYLACSCRRHASDDIVRMLLEKGANARWKDNLGFSAISCACEFGHLSIVEMLLNHDNGLLEIESNSGCTALCVAICLRQVDVVRFLLSRDANVHATLNHGCTTLMLASRYPDILRLLLDTDVDLEARDNMEKTALHYAARPTGFIEAVRELIEEHNANMLAVDIYGQTPFDVAAQEHDPASPEVVDCFLQAYGNNVTQDFGRLALHAILHIVVYSFFENVHFHPPLLPLRIRLPLGNLTIQHFRTLFHFLDAEVIRNRDESGNLPIHIACEENAQVEVLSMLVEMDPATLHIADHTGSLPVHLLCCSGTTPIDDASVRYLVEQGGVGTLAARNHNGALPLHNLVASTNPPLRTVQYLIHSFAGAVTARMNDGRYPFMVAACETSSASLSVVYELVRPNPNLIIPHE